MASLRVRVLLYQDTGHAIGGARVVVDGRSPVTTNPNGIADFGQIPKGAYKIKVEPTGVDPLSECQCHICHPPVLPKKYFCLREQEYPEVNHQQNETKDVYVDQCVRAKLGGVTQVVGPSTVSNTWIRFYLPQTKGATDNQGSGYTTTWQLETDNGQLELLDGRTANKHEGIMGPQPAGWYYARLVGGDAGTANITLQMREEAYAREGEGYNQKPLIPWTFFYWPTNQGNNTTSRHPCENDRRGSPLYALDKLFNRDPENRNSAFGWERDPTHAHCNEGSSWAGHCNIAASASIIFEEPPKDYIYGPNRCPKWFRHLFKGHKYRLDCEGLKLVASEFAGHHSVTELCVMLDKNQGVDLDTLRSVDGDPEWKQEDKRNRQREFGSYAVHFLGTLQRELGELGFPLLTDVRTGTKTGKKRDSAITEVWNQAVYFYRVDYREHPESESEHPGSEERQAQDLKLEVKIFWNEDYWPTYGQNLQTAEVVETEGRFQITPREEDRRKMSLWRALWMRLQFSSNGQVNNDDPLNALERCFGKGQRSFYLPRYLMKIREVTRQSIYTEDNRNPGSFSIMGNEKVGAEIFEKLPIKKRQRYS